MTTLLSVSQAINALSSRIPEVASQTGDAKVISTKEVRTALKAGTINKSEAKILMRALSDGPSDLDNVKKTLQKYIQAFTRADSNGNGRSETAERKKHQAALDNWAAIAASPHSTREEKDAAFKSVITNDLKKKSGEVIQVPVYSIKALLTHLQKLMDLQ